MCGEMKILIKNLVKRRPGYTYLIDAAGNVVESPGPGVFNIKEKQACADSNPGQMKQLRNSTIRKSRGTNSTLRKEAAPATTMPGHSRTSKIQKEILNLCQEEIELKKVIQQGLLCVQHNSTLTFQSIYRSIDNLAAKGLLKKYKKSEYGLGPIYIKSKGR